eukprot:5067359-Amphidinium_carterae.1
MACIAMEPEKNNGANECRPSHCVDGERLDQGFGGKWALGCNHQRTNVVTVSWRAPNKSQG